jgi:hypothetical protein
MLDEQDKLLVARIKEIALAADGGDEHASEILEEILDQVEDRDEVGDSYDDEDTFYCFEARCWSCGAILSTVERGHEWQGWSPQFMKCVRCQP